MYSDEAVLLTRNLLQYHSQRYIAKFLKVSRGFVKYVADGERRTQEESGEGVTTLGKKHKWEYVRGGLRNPKRGEAIQLYLDGRTLKEAAKVADVCYQRVSQWLKEDGIKARKRGAKK